MAFKPCGYPAFREGKTPTVSLDGLRKHQLSCRKYYFTSNGKQKVESKEEMKKRGLASPDEADCMLLVCLPVNYKKKGAKKNNA